MKAALAHSARYCLAVDQLTGESATGGATGSDYSNAFSYDSMGNRTRLENAAGANTRVATSTANALNQLTALSTSHNGGAAQNSGLSYDAGGNLTQATAADGSKTLYSYDDGDRLIRIENHSAANAPLSKSEFTYDFASRKAISQEFTYTLAAWVPQSETRRVFNGLDVIQERNALNEVTAQYTRDGNIGGILARASASGKSYFHYDGGGNVTALSDETGNLVGRYSYDAFGNTLEASGARAAENPYRFSTKEYHAASGMVDFGYRFYSPGMGRWLNRDPIQEDGGINLYAMVENDPVNDWDEYGLVGGFQNDIDRLSGKIANTMADIDARRLDVRNNSSRANPLPWSTPDYKTNHRGSVKGHIFKINELKQDVKNQKRRLAALQERQRQWLRAMQRRRGGFIRFRMPTLPAIPVAKLIPVIGLLSAFARPAGQGSALYGPGSNPRRRVPQVYGPPPRCMTE